MTEETELEGLRALSRDEILDLINTDIDGFVEQLKEALEIGNDGFDELFGYGDPEERTVNGFTLKSVYEEGGGEGGGESVERVYAIIETAAPKVHLKYIRLDGFYTSHHGTDWDEDPYEVFPHAVTRTEYYKAGESPTVETDEDDED